MGRDAKMGATKKLPVELPARRGSRPGWGLSRGQATLIEDNTLPTFRPPGRTTRCACKSP